MPIKAFGYILQYGGIHDVQIPPDIGRDKERGRKLHQDHALYSELYNFPLAIFAQFSKYDVAFSTLH